VFLAAGALALTVQIILLRELMVAMQGDEISLATGLSAWLAGIAAGAAAGRRIFRKRPGALAGTALAALAAGGPMGTVALRTLPHLLAPPAGELFTVGSSIALAVMVLAPAGALVGIAFTSLAGVAAGAGWAAGRAITALYVLEATGALLAGLAVTFLVVPLSSPLAGVAWCCLAWIVPAYPAAARGAVGGRFAFPVLAAMLLVAALPPVSGPVERATAAARFSGTVPGIPVVETADTPYTHAVVGGGEVKHLYESGLYVASFPDDSGYEAEAHRIASLAPAPGRVLLFGNAAAGLVRHLLLHPVEAVDLVVLDREASDLVRKHLGSADRLALGDPRVRVAHDDPRTFLRATEERYGLIVVREPEPATLLAARLSTVEFYRSCRSRLEEDGILVAAARTGPNVLRGETARLAGSLFRSLRQVFPVVLSGPGPDSLLIAGSDPSGTTLDPAVLARRFAGRGIRSEVFVPELFPILFPPDRVEERQRRLEEIAPEVPPSLDARPVSFLHALALRQRIDGSFAAPLIGRVTRIPPVYLCVLALLPSLAVLLRVRFDGDPVRGARLAVLHAVAVTGGCGLGWSLLVLFSYQTREGALYGRIGLLTALFMLGLALGGFCLRRHAGFEADRARRRLQMASTAVLLYAALIALAMHLVRSLPVLSHGALMLGSGFVTGALFPVATGALLAAGCSVRGTAGRLETADHAGASLAALAAGVIFIPALGMVSSALLLVVMAGLALQGVLLGLRRPAGD
jgi:spermidine synthase